MIEALTSWAYLVYPLIRDRYWATKQSKCSFRHEMILQRREHEYEVMLKTCAYTQVHLTATQWLREG